MNIFYFVIKHFCPKIPVANRKCLACDEIEDERQLILKSIIPLVSDPGMHYGTCVTHVPWCMSGSLTCGDEENVPGIPGACAPAIVCIWQEAHALWGCFMGSGTTMLLSGWRGGDRDRYGWLRRNWIACAVHGICCTCSLPNDYMVLFTCV